MPAEEVRDTKVHAFDKIAAFPQGREAQPLQDSYFTNMIGYVRMCLISVSVVSFFVLLIAPLEGERRNRAAKYQAQTELEQQLEAVEYKSLAERISDFFSSIFSS